MRELNRHNASSVFQILVRANANSLDYFGTVTQVPCRNSEISIFEVNPLRRLKVVIKKESVQKVEPSERFLGHYNGQSGPTPTTAVSESHHIAVDVPYRITPFLFSLTIYLQITCDLIPLSNQSYAVWKVEQIAYAILLRVLQNYPIFGPLYAHHRQIKEAKRFEKRTPDTEAWHV